MKVVSSLKGLLNNCSSCRAVKRRGKTYVICKKPNNRKHNAVQA